MRVVVTAAAAFAAFVQVMACMLFFGPPPLSPIQILISALASALVAWYAWRATGSPEFAGFVGSVFLGAVVIGGIGFLGGFLGPMIFAPSSNQGPLLGIFITGPLGFVAGAIGGGIRWFWQRRHAPSDHTHPPR